MPKKKADGKPPATKGILIHQLQALALELKRTPTSRDITAASRRGKCLGIWVYKKQFKTLRNALKQARLPLNFNQEFTRSQLLNQLKDLARALGRNVTEEDVAKASRAGACARVATFKKSFGSLHAALREAGVSAYNKQSYTREELLQQLVALSKELSRAPSAGDIDSAAKAGKCAYRAAFRRHFGSLGKARKLAGLFGGKLRRRKYDRDALIRQLQALAKRLGRVPTAADVRLASLRDECAGVKTFRSFFGGHNQALRAAGLAINRPHAYSQGQVLGQLRKLAQKLGRVPTRQEITEANKRGECASTGVFDHFFGGVQKAARAAKLSRLIK